MTAFRPVALLGALLAVTPGAAAAQAPVAPQPFTRADVEFMQGMIHHHAQAVTMAGWAPSHGAGDAVRRLCERIVVAQNDEIASMQHWLDDRHQEVPEVAAGGGHGGHSHGGDAHDTMMPGMLSPAQMDTLERARGVEFDRYFLTYMMQHHRGALAMVDALLGARGAAQDDVVFKMAADIAADQTSEIDRMTAMLAALPARR